MSSWARAGVKCVCVDDSSAPGKCWIKGHRPFKGETYTIANTSRTISGNDGVFLEEFSLKSGLPLRLNRFRPIISQADDVAMFTKPVETMKPTERLDVLAEMLDE